MENNRQKAYDLLEGTEKFGEGIIEFSKKIPKTPITFPLVSQLVRSGTSVGANYCEADCAESRKDFIHKIGICKKEAKETKYWLRMLAKADENLREGSKILWLEANELQLIFIAIVNKARQNNRNDLGN